MDRKDLIKLAIDTYRGAVAGNYSVADGAETLRQALIEANGGSEKIDPRAMRKNGGAIFEILEVLIPALVQEGLKGDEFYMNLVEERRLAEGDRNEFWVEDNSAFVVAEMANGVATPRRQRIGHATSKEVKTTMHQIRIYEEMNRVLAGRVTWTEFVDKVVDSFKKNLYNDIFTAFSGIDSTTEGVGTTYAPAAGTYNEANLLTLVEHIEAATGKNAMIIGTKTALRKVDTAIMADQAKNDYYNAGYFGKVAGVPMVAIRNQHRVGTETFIFPDDKLYIIASDDKPIKVVYEGDGLILEKDPMTNADLSYEYLYAEKYGVGVIVNGKIGVYTLA